MRLIALKMINRKKPKQPSNESNALKQVPPIDPSVENNDDQSKKSKPALKNDISGKWRTDENEIWIIKQSGSEISITFCDEYGNPKDAVEGKIEGQILSYHSLRSGKDKKGSFSISDDFKSMKGKIKVFLGTFNTLTITKIE